MASSSQDDLSPEALRQLPVSQLEKTVMDSFKLQGAIVYSTLDDAYHYYPGEGFGDAGGLQEQCPFALDKTELTVALRETPFKLQFDTSTDRFVSYLQCKVSAGKILS